MFNMSREEETTEDTEEGLKKVDFHCLLTVTDYNKMEVNGMNTVELIQSIKTEYLFEKICHEKPEMIAQILVCMNHTRAADVFQKFQTDIQILVIENIVKIKEISAQQLTQIETLLTGQTFDSSDENYPVKGGIDFIVNVLCLTHKDTFNNIIEKLDKTNSELSDEIIKMMSVFEDIVMLPDNDVKIVLKDIDDFDLGKALKGVDSEVVEWIFRRIPEKRIHLKKIMDEMGLVKKEDIKEAQWKITKHIRNIYKQRRIRQ